MRFLKKNKLPPFVALSREMLKGAEWRKLSSSAKVLYIHIKHKFVKTNNGEIRLYYSELRDMMSDGTILSAFRELEAEEWIERQRIGGKYRWVCDIRLTGKHDNIIF